MKAIVIFLSFILLFPVGGVIEEKIGSEKIESMEAKEVASSYATLLAENKPVVPVYIKTYVFPAGSKFSIEVKAKDIESIDMQLKPSYIPAPPGYEIKEGSYDKDIIYPANWYEWDAMAGIKNGKHVIILNLYLYPIRYIAGEVLKANNFEIKVSYIPPSQPLFNKDEYDLLIICPSQWKEDLQPLKEHKESHGIKTIIVSLDEIYGGKYFATQGRDSAEKIKYFIKDAIENWGIEYVMLVGGRKPGIKEDWLMPVRYVYVTWPEVGYVETKYISDLYYADVYDANYSFSSWDTDGNGVYSEWKRIGQLQDELDLYPDVYIGRLACRNKAELKLMVEKIISYENSKTNKKAVLVGGDNFEQEGYEGEIVCDKALEYLPGFEYAKVYASQMDVNPKNIRQALGNGAMFMLLHGHGSPIYWSTHKPDGFDKWEPGIGIWDLPSFFNEELPIVILGGCHTAMFNVSLTIHPWTGGIPAPEGLSWWFARKYNGGGIASFGYTAFPVATPGNEGDLDGNGIDEPDCVESGYGYMQLGLFEAYSNGKDMLGELWQYAVARYVEHFKLPYQRYHLHTIQSFVLLGDPSLKIGGY